VTLDVVWNELQALTAPGAVGRFKRRVHPESPLDLFVGVAKPANQRLLMMLASEASLGEASRLPSSQGVEARIVRPGEDGREVTLELALIDPRFTDIFTALAADIIDSIATITNEYEAVSEFVGRLRRWQQFLEESGLEGLSPERQRGLFAELWLARDLLDDLDPTSVIQAWTGPDHTSHDFQFGPCAVEVKGTAAKQHQVLRIVSERQLDDTGVDSLYLFHLSLDVHRGAGATLPSLIELLRSRLQNTAVAHVLEAKLIQHGYLEQQRELYEDAGYTPRESNLFRVRDGFPRIIERDLVPGVGDVHYSISVAECKHFSVDRAVLIDEIKGVAT
jgi:hypothetical protein